MGTLGGATARAVPLPNPQQWHTYLRGVALGLELTRPDNCKLPGTLLAPPSKELSRLMRRGAKFKEAAKEIFTICMPTMKAFQFLVWHDRVVWRHNQLDFPALNWRLLVWDAQEHNFRLEFLTLDHCILASIWATTEGAVVRNGKFGAMWPDEVVLMAELPEDGSIGLAAGDWKKRARFVKAFRRIIMDWPGEIPEQLSQLSFHQRAKGSDVWNEPVMKRVETLASTHYCQIFFDYFGRAPCIPCIFPTI
ncbi:hypothetical protein P691DRAFT_797940 [Macrolepiota fuliginosa MF-IS2]|uniref:Uncharacterized protein n=1 Tax=Macrolepiota fuliginosa MF-IS2 TaxID=1400762 RepID=A0A9P5X425_9AGAR|nr:hypothetical protein P691DRAFT_797940 [Macrolepiota fuliginosa MF-IS2]